MVSSGKSFPAEQALLPEGILRIDLCKAIDPVVGIVADGAGSSVADIGGSEGAGKIVIYAQHAFAVLRAHGVEVVGCEVGNGALRPTRVFLAVHM